MKLADIIKTAQTWEPSFTEWLGKPAPDFTITYITGKKHKISQYKGSLKFATIGVLTHKDKKNIIKAQ